MNIKTLIYIIFISIYTNCAWSAEIVLPASAGTPPKLVFGFLPILSAERLVKRYLPLVAYLSRRAQLDIRMETAPDFAAFIQRTQHGRRYDILFTAPHFFYLAEQQPGYRGLVRVNLDGMKAVVVVPVQSSIRTLSELRGHSLATTGPLALSTLLLQNLLVQAGLVAGRDLRLVATPSHIAALLSSYRGNTDAAAVMQPVFRRVRAQIKDNMRIIASSVTVPHIPLAAAPWVDVSIAQRLQRILVDMPHDADGRRVLEHLNWPGFVPIKPHEYDTLRPLAEQMGMD